MKFVNRYSALLMPGVVGQVNTTDYEIKTIINNSLMCAQIRVGELLPDVWDFGLHIIRPGMEAYEKFPGEGQGWFKSREDALLYGMTEAKRYFQGSHVCDLIDVEIGKVENRSLFD